MNTTTKLLILCALLSTAGCLTQQVRKDTAPAAPEAPAAASAPSASAAAAPPEGAPPSFRKGKVVETMSGGGYTYVCIENEGRRRWAAMPPTQVEVGQEVELAPGIEMHNFSSRAFSRTFEWITFCSGLAKPGSPKGTGEAAATGEVVQAVPEGKAERPPLPASHPALPPTGTPVPEAALPPGHPALPATGAAAAGAAQAPEAAAPPNIVGKVVETMDAAGYTYACVEKEGARTWVAVPLTELTVGQDAEFAPGNTMANFKSKALGRTFESIVFSGGLVKAR